MQDVGTTDPAPFSGTSSTEAAVEMDDQVPRTSTTPRSRRCSSCSGSPAPACSSRASCPSGRDTPTARALAGRSGRRAGRAGDPGRQADGDRRPRDRGRRPLAVPAGRDPRARHHGGADDRRAGAGEGRPVRRRRPRSRWAPTTTAAQAARNRRRDRGLPAGHVRHRRHDALRLGQRPADDVHRARGALAAAVPDVRAGPQRGGWSARKRRSSTSCSARTRRRSSCSVSRWSTASPAGPRTGRAGRPPASTSPPSTPRSRRRPTARRCSSAAWR